MTRRTHVKDFEATLMKTEYLGGKTITQIAEKWDLCWDTIYNNLKKLGVKTRAGSTKYVDFSKKRDLAYIYGVVRGDGWATYCDATKRYEVGLSARDKCFVEKFRDVLTSVGLKSWFGFRDRNEENYSRLWRTSVNGKLLKQWIDKQDPLNFKTEEEISAFLEGFYESDGTTKDFTYTNTNLDLLEKTNELLIKMGVTASLTGPYKNTSKQGKKWKDYWFLRIRAESVPRFRELINPVNKYNLVK